MSKSKARTEADLAVKDEKADPKPRAGPHALIWVRRGSGFTPRKVRASVSFKALRLRILFLSLNWNIIPSLESDS